MAAQIPQEVIEKIKQVSPGTKLRKALDQVIEAQLGALIVFINEDEMKAYPQVFQAGFKIDALFSPERLYELSKMDGAIVVDEHVSRILAANVHLVPDPSIPTSETGTRHRTAERIAKQLKKMVIAISKRRNVVTLYYKEYKHVFEDMKFVLTKVSQTLNTLERFREIFDRDLELLNYKEIEGNVTLDFICGLLLRSAEIHNIASEIQLQIIELGIEGKLASLRLREVLRDLDELTLLLIMDYHKKDVTEEDARKLMEEMWDLEYKHLTFAKFLGYDVSSTHKASETFVVPRGYRLLRTAIHIPMNVSQKVIDSYRNLGNLIKTDVNHLQEIDGIGKKRAKAILKTIKSIKRRRG